MEKKKNNKIINFEDTFINQIIIECLSSHNNLTSEDIKFVANMNCNLFKNNKILSKFCLHSCQETFVGQFSLIFNRQLDEIIKGQDITQFVKLLQLSSKEYWPELYDNILITNQEKNELESVYKHELTAILNMIEYKFSIKIPYQEKLFLRYNSKIEELHPNVGKSNIFSKLLPNDHDISNFVGTTNNLERSKKTLYQKCYDDVVVSFDKYSNYSRGKNNKIIEEKNKGSILSFDENDMTIELGDCGNFIKTIMISFPLIDDQNETFLFSIYKCYDKMELINGLSLLTPIDPLTGVNFPQEIEEFLLKKYQKEIKLYSKYIIFLENNNF